MSDSDPNDLDAADAVVADDALVERLRHALSPDAAVVWDDDDEDSDDLSYGLLRALQRDVSADLPAPAAAGVVVPLASRRRRLGRSATVAAVAVGVLSAAGVAAAATSSPGSPLYGVRSAVSSAVHDALDAVTPSKSAPSAPVAATPTVTLSPPGTQVSTAARSANAVIVIDERLALAARLVAAGRGTAAGEVLDQAQRRLPLVSDPAQRSDFQQRIDALRVQVAALLSPHRKPTSGPAVDHGRSASHQPQARPTPSRSAAAHRGDNTPSVPTAHPSRTADPVKPSAPKVPVLPVPAASAQSR